MNLTQANGIREEGSPVKEVPPPGQVVGTSVEQCIVGGASPGLGLLGSIKKQAV